LIGEGNTRLPQIGVLLERTIARRRSRGVNGFLTIICYYLLWGVGFHICSAEDSRWAGVLWLYEADHETVPYGGEAVPGFLPSCQCRCNPACQPALPFPRWDEAEPMF